MSTAIIPDEGMVYLLGKCEGATLKVKLYTTNVSVGKSTVLADLATEASFPGYAAVTVSWGSITIPANVATNVAVSATFTRNSSSGSPQTIKVWALVDESAGKIVCARNPGDQIFTNTGDAFVVTITAKEGDLP